MNNISYNQVYDQQRICHTKNGTSFAGHKLGYESWKFPVGCGESDETNWVKQSKSEGIRGL